MKPTAVDLDIADLVATCYHDPLRFVRAAYPWGEPGPLQHHTGPDVWQTQFLTDLGASVTERAFDGQTADAGRPALRAQIKALLMPNGDCLTCIGSSRSDISHDEACPVPAVVALLGPDEGPDQRRV